MKPAQHSIAEQVACDRRPIHEWANSMHNLRGRLYELDPELSRQFDELVQHIASSAMDLDCIGHGDPSAPSVGAPTEDVLRYLFRIWPETEKEFRKLFTRADQVLGRHRLLEQLR